jgi:hypothetical protein
MTFSKLHIEIQAAIRRAAKDHQTAGHLQVRLNNMGVENKALFDAIDQAHEDGEKIIVERFGVDLAKDTYKIVICPAEWDKLDAVLSADFAGRYVEMTEPRPGSPVRAIIAMSYQDIKDILNNAFNSLSDIGWPGDADTQGRIGRLLADIDDLCDKINDRAQTERNKTETAYRG